MGEVIDFESVRRQRIEEYLHEAVSNIRNFISSKITDAGHLRKSILKRNSGENNIQTSLDNQILNEEFVNEVLILNHERNLRHAKKGRSFIGNVQKDEIFKYVHEKRRNGYCDIVVEKDAIGSKSKGFVYVPGFYGVYGKKPAFYNPPYLRFDSLEAI